MSGEGLGNGKSFIPPSNEDSIWLIHVVTWLCEAMVCSREGPPACYSCQRATALLRGRALEDICTTETWASLCPLFWFCLRDTSEFSLSVSHMGRGPLVSGKGITDWPQTEPLKVLSCSKFIRIYILCSRKETLSLRH